MARNKELVAYWGQVFPGQEYGINRPIYFKDGARGMIRSVIEVKAQSDGRVFVKGQCIILPNAKKIPEDIRGKFCHAERS